MSVSLDDLGHVLISCQSLYDASISSAESVSPSFEIKTYSPSALVLGQNIILDGWYVVSSKSSRPINSAVRRAMASYSSGVTSLSSGMIHLYFGVFPLCLCVL